VTEKAQRKAATAWGDALVVDRIVVQQRAGERRFASVVELLEGARGERLLRFSYTTDGTARRGPVTLRARDLERLRNALADHPAIAEVIAIGGA
jgi:hypothetical protein